MRKIIVLIYDCFYVMRKCLYKFVIMPAQNYKLANCGENVYIGENSSITYKNVHIGNEVYVGPRAFFLSTRAQIFIGNHVMFGPNVFLITGNHRIDIIGSYMINVKESEKLPEDDQDIIIEDDVWIGANAIILKGVTIGEGSVIAAGSIVTKNIEPYSVCAGIPAKKIRNRFSKEEQEKHKMMLNSNLGM